jgi:hypothetical protein
MASRHTLMMRPTALRLIEALRLIQAQYGSYPDLATRFQTMNEAQIQSFIDDGDNYPGLFD